MIPALLLGRVALAVACPGRQSGPSSRCFASRLAVRGRHSVARVVEQRQCPWALVFPTRGPRSRVACHGATVPPAPRSGNLPCRVRARHGGRALVVVRVDPRRVRLALDTAFVDGNAGWSLDRAGAVAVAAVNAGQFVRSMPGLGYARRRAIPATIGCSACFDLHGHRAARRGSPTRPCPIRRVCGGPSSRIPRCSMPAKCLINCARPAGGGRRASRRAPGARH